MNRRGGFWVGFAFQGLDYPRFFLAYKNQGYGFFFDFAPRGIITQNKTAPQNPPRFFI